MQVQQHNSINNTGRNTKIGWSAVNNQNLFRASGAGGSKFENAILKPDFSAARLKLAPGETWARILPAMASSNYSWMLGVHAIESKNGRYVHPRTFRGGKNPVDHAYSWLRVARPELLRSKENPDGIRLLPDPLGVCWMLVRTPEGRYVPRLLQASLYDGSRGGTQGLAYQLLTLSVQTDESGQPAHDILSPDNGVQIMLAKMQPKGSQYPSYSLRVGRNPVPVDDMVAFLSDEDYALIRPLEEVIANPSDDEVWTYLGSIIPGDMLDAMRAEY